MNLLRYVCLSTTYMYLQETERLIARVIIIITIKLHFSLYMNMEYILYSCIKNNS